MLLRFSKSRMMGTGFGDAQMSVIALHTNPEDRSGTLMTLNCIMVIAEHDTSEGEKSICYCSLLQVDTILTAANTTLSG